MTIIENLQNKTAKEKAQIKSQEIAKLSISRYIKKGFDIKIVGDIKAIEVNGSHGIELFATAYKNGKQLGFGKDGTVEIERFRIFNPPVLVDDPNGDIIREWEEEDPDTGLKIKKQRKLKYNPTEAIQSTLAHTISVVAKDGKDIIKEKIGHTTDTFYPSFDGVCYIQNGTSWNEMHDRSASQGVETTPYNISLQADGTTRIYRAVILFDTSAISPDSVSSATLSLYGRGISSDDNNDGNDFVAIVSSTPASNDALIADDYDQIGDAINNPTEMHNNSDRIDIGVYSVTAYNDFPFNTTGISNISVSGITKLGVRLGHDIVDDPISGHNEVNFFSMDEDGTDNDPKLVVEHSAGSTGTNMQINISDSWKSVDSIKINIGDSWKSVTSIKQNIGDSWKTVF